MLLNHNNDSRLDLQTLAIYEAVLSCHITSHQPPKAGKSKLSSSTCLHSLNSLLTHVAMATLVNGVFCFVIS